MNRSMFLLQFLVSEHYGSPLFLVKPTETATPR